jgi:hypothetical protein
VVSVVSFLSLNVLKNKGIPINHLHRLTAFLHGSPGIGGISGVVISIDHDINLSGRLYFVVPGTLPVWLNFNSRSGLALSLRPLAKCSISSSALNLANSAVSNDGVDATNDGSVIIFAASSCSALTCAPDKLGYFAVLAKSKLNAYSFGQDANVEIAFVQSVHTE